MWHYLIIYIMTIDYGVSLTTLSVQLPMHVTNCMVKCVHPNTVIKIKNKIISLLAWHGIYYNNLGALKYNRSPQRTNSKAHE